jgi:hypothetical protein
VTVLTLAPARPALDVHALRADLHQVLAAHGLADADYLDVSVRPMTQSGSDVGVAISATAWSNPAAPAPLVAAMPGGAS